MKQRKLYFDTIKLFAIFVIFTTHFLADFHDEYLDMWTTLPTSILLRGVTGKFGVAIFSVILGYFAFRSSERNIAKYTIKRYVYFVLCGLFINAVYAAEAYFTDGDPITLSEVVHTSIILGDSIYPTFWCIRPFMAGSFASRVNRFICDRSTAAGLLITVVEIAALIYYGQIWIAICIMGNLVPVLEDSSFMQKILGHRIVRVAIYIFAFFAIKRSSSDVTFLIDGAVTVLVLLALSKSEYVIRPLNNKYLASAGKNTMAIYLIHVIVYMTVGSMLINDADFTASFIMAYAVSWIAIVILSYPVTFMLNGVNGLFSRGIDLVIPSGKNSRDDKDPRKESENGQTNA